MNSSAGEVNCKFVPRYFHDSYRTKILAKYPRRAADSGAISQPCDWQERYLKLDDGTTDGIVQGTGSVFGRCARVSRSPIQRWWLASTGNHGAAVALAAKQFDVKARIFLPANCNPAKRGRIVSFGAAIVESKDSDPASAFALVAEYAKRPGVYFLNDATDTDLPAGPATIGCEILEQLPETSAIVVPMGDTALIRGNRGGNEADCAASENHRRAGRGRSLLLFIVEGRQSRWNRDVRYDRDGLATRTPEAANVRDVKRLVDDVAIGE